MNRILILFALCVAQTSFSEEHEDWRSIRPQVTTEAELVARFGAPAEVVTTFPWSEWTAKWKKRPIVSRFTLRYTIQESKSPLLDGPAGPADSVEVAMHDSKVVSVMWRYGGSSAKAAAQLLRANSNLKMGPTETTSRAFGGSLGQSLVVEFGPNDTQVDVRLELK
jgi:rhodanese-related sulfurtransferase